jgi:hypothetical protein
MKSDLSPQAQNTYQACKGKYLDLKEKTEEDEENHIKCTREYPKVSGLS